MERAKVLVLTDQDCLEVRQTDPVGKPWRYRETTVYMAKQNGDKLESFDPTVEITRNNGLRLSPEELFDATDWSLAKVVYKLGEDKIAKINMGLLVALVGILCFFVFLIFSSVTGG